MSDERLQRIEELLHDLNVKVERSLASSEARVDNCHERFDANEAVITKLSAKIDGNGAPGISTRLDRIEQTITGWKLRMNATLTGVIALLVKLAYDWLAK